MDLIVINSQKSKIENKINENKNQTNNNKSNLNNEEKKREINNNVLENKLKQIGNLFKTQFYLMQNDITNMINNKYKEIKDELKKLNVQVNNKNNNEIIEERIEKSNEHYKQNQNQKENKSNKKKENKNKQDKNNKDYMLNEKSVISSNNIIKENDDLEFINNFIKINEEDNRKENNLTKEDIMNAHGSTIFNFNNTKLNDKIFEKIMKNINSLYKNKNYSYKEIKAKGNDIFEIMSKNKEIHRIEAIEIIKINNNIKNCLTEGQKKDLSLNEKMKHCNLLKYLNYCLEIKNIQTTLDDKLKKDIDLENDLEKIKQNKRDKEILKESIKDKNKPIIFIDTLNKNINKINVQQNLEEIFNILKIKL